MCVAHGAVWAGLPLPVDVSACICVKHVKCSADQEAVTGTLQTRRAPSAAAIFPTWPRSAASFRSSTAPALAEPTMAATHTISATLRAARQPHMQERCRGQDMAVGLSGLPLPLEGRFCQILTSDVLASRHTGYHWHCGCTIRIHISIL